MLNGTADICERECKIDFDAVALEINNR